MNSSKPDAELPEALKGLSVEDVEAGERDIANGNSVTLDELRQEMKQPGKPDDEIKAWTRKWDGRLNSDAAVNELIALAREACDENDRLREMLFDEVGEEATDER